MVRQQAQKDEYGPLFEVNEVKPGLHGLHDENGLCPYCGRLQHVSPQYEALRDPETGRVPYGVISETCFEYAAFTVEFTYNDQGHRALYGVPPEGTPSCWMS